MSPVKAGATIYRHDLGGEVWEWSRLHRAREELETTVDQALIRGLSTAFRVFVPGLSSG
jgi:hypothetical protein